MRHVKNFVSGLWFVFIISCSQPQGDPARNGAVKENDAKTAVDTEAVESYWTKEKMDKSKPMPSPTVIIKPDAPESSQPIKQQDGQGAHGYPPLSPPGGPKDTHEKKPESDVEKN